MHNQYTPHHLHSSIHQHPYHSYIDCSASLLQGPLDRIGRHLHAIERELQAANEHDYNQLTRAESAATSPSKRVPIPQLPADVVMQELGMQLHKTATVSQNILPLKLKPLPKQQISPEGSGHEIMLQAFNWESWHQNWWETLEGQVDAIADMGFTVVWLPPPTDSVSQQGYMPRDLYNLNSNYGSQEQLVRLIRKLQSRGIKVVGDAVLNHRCAQAQDAKGIWNQFGGRMSWDERAIVGDDPNYHGAGNRSSGDIFTSAPNVDHSQGFVKQDVSEWLQWLRTEIGFDGWRLDFVKGFHGSHVKDYMEASVPQFSVGEYWDALSYEWDGSPSNNQDNHRQRTVNWINAAGGLSTAFDITSKGIMHAVFERCEFWRLRDGAGKPPGLIGWWPSRAVTFIENHDTGSTQGHWRFPHHAMEQGYCYILTHPGTPCVFYDHVFQDRHLAHAVERLLALRRRHKIHCRSEVKILQASHDVYAASIDDAIVMKIGPGDFAPDASKYHIADCGHGWAVWEHKDKVAESASKA